MVCPIIREVNSFSGRFILRTGHLGVNEGPMPEINRKLHAGQLFVKSFHSSTASKMFFFTVT